MKVGDYFRLNVLDEVLTYKVDWIRIVFPEETDEPDKPDGELPDTGLTSWPVPVMAVSGAVLICVGIILRRAERKTR